MPTTFEKIPDVVLYGGSFDPPHEGHADCLRLVAQSFAACSVRVLPAFQPAAAAGAAKTPSAPFESRVALCREAFQGLSVSVETWEAALPQPNFTVRTLSHAAGILPGKRLGFLMGQDQLEAFHLWNDPRGILDRASLIVVGRSSPAGSAVGTTHDSLRAAVTSLAARLALALTWSKGGQEASFAGVDGRILLLDEPEDGVCPAASHVIRSHLATGAPVPAGWLAPKVARYITEHQLYTHEPDRDSEQQKE